MEELISEVKKRAMGQIGRHVNQWRHLRKELRSNTVNIIPPKELSDNDKKWLEEYFTQNVFPVLTPMAIDPSNPVPQIASRAICIAVQLQEKVKLRLVHAFIPLPLNLNRVVQLPGPEPVS